jgi:hypothetical protein
MATTKKWFYELQGKVRDRLNDHSATHACEYQAVSKDFVFETYKCFDANGQYIGTISAAMYKVSRFSNGYPGVIRYFAEDPTVFTKRFTGVSMEVCAPAPKELLDLAQELLDSAALDMAEHNEALSIINRYK